MMCGKEEINNGFEFLRQVFLEIKGSGVTIAQDGRKAFNAYGKCSSFKDLARHLDGWKIPQKS